MSNNEKKTKPKTWQLIQDIKNMELEIGAHKQIARVLKSREDRFKTIFFHAPVAYFLIDLNGNFIDGNIASHQLTGYSTEELFGKNFIELNLIDKSDQKTISEILSRSGKGEYTGPDELSMKRKDGSFAFIELMTSPVTISDKKLVLGSAHDITNRKLTQEKLDQSEIRFKKLTETAIDAIIMMDNKGLVSYWNNAAERIFGYNYKEAIGKEIHKLIAPPKYYAAFQKGFERFLKTGKGKAVGNVLEMTGLKKDNSEFPVEISLSAFMLSEEWHVTAIIKDITERKESEAKLQASEERFRKLFDSAHDALMTLNPPTWKFTSGNPAILKMFKVKSIKEFLTYGPWDVSPEKQPDGRLSSDKAKEMIEIAMTKGSNFFKWTHKRINGESFPATVLLIKIQLKDETFLQATVSDITEQKKAEEVKNVLINISNSVNVTKNLNDLYFTIHNLLAKIIDVSNFFIALVDIKNRTLHFPYHVDTTDDDFSSISNFNTNDSLTGLVVSQRKPILLKKEELEKRDAQKGVWGPTPLIWMGVPLIIKNDVIGVIATQSYVDPNLYTMQDLEILSAVSDQVAIAIDRKRSEDALRDSEKKYKDLFEKSKDAVLIIINEKFVDCNQATINMLRYKNKDEFLNTHPSELSPKMQPDGRLSSEKADEMMKIAYKNGSHRFEWDHKRANGEVFPVEVLLTAISTDKKNQILHTVWRDITNRKKDEVELKQSEERFRRLFNDLGDAVYVTKLRGENRGEILEVNNGAEIQTGYTRKELLKMNIIKDLYISGSGKIKADDWEERLGQGETVKTTEKKMRKDGTEFWTDVIVTSIQFKGENAGLSINHDITERKQKEKALKENEEKYRSLTENLPLGIYRNTPGAKGKILEVNKALTNMFGFKDRESMLETNVSSLYVSPSARKIYSDKLIREGSIKDEEEYFLRQDGSTFIGSSTAIAVKDENGKIVHYDGIIENITERVELRKKLQENEEKFRSIVYNSPDIIAQVDRQGIISFINYGYSGMEPTNIIGKTIYDLMPSEFHEVARDTLKKVFDTGKSFSFENLGLSTDDSVVWYKNNISVLRKEGKVIAATIIASDISEQKQTDIMKTEFISSVSHELRTPLTIIRESLSLLSDGLFGELNKDQMDIVNPAMEDVDRLGRIINNLLDISKIEGQKIIIEREMVDIVKLAEGVVSSFGNQVASKNIKLKLTPNRESINLYLDNDRIIQVLMNLIGNALKFTVEGKIEVFIMEKENVVECCVADTGRGIEHKDLGTVFDRFHQVGKVVRAAEKGTGLGLSISKGIIKLHRGKIWVNSKLNQGSRFYFTLPKYSPDEIIIENIEKSIDAATKKHIKLSLLLVRVDNYSEIETKLGDADANRIPKGILKAFQDQLAPGEFSFIKGRNEIVLFSDITEQNIQIIISKLEEMLAKSSTRFQKELDVKLSFGYSIYPNDAKHASDLIEAAYKTMKKR